MAGHHSTSPAGRDSFREQEQQAERGKRMPVAACAAYVSEIRDAGGRERNCGAHRLCLEALHVRDARATSDVHRELCGRCSVSSLELNERCERRRFVAFHQVIAAVTLHGAPL